MYIFIKKIKDDCRGLTALLVVLIIASAIFTLSFGSIFFSLGDLEMGFDNRKSSEAFYATDGCMEETLRRLQYDETYSGETLNFSNFSCIINISSAGSNKNIVVTGIVGNYSKKIEAMVTVSGSIVSLNSWQEKEN